MNEDFSQKTKHDIFCIRNLFHYIFFSHSKTS